MSEVIHCKTQDEWDFVTEKYNLVWNKLSVWSNYGQESCINYKINMYGRNKSYMASGDIVLSFNEWLTRENLSRKVENNDLGYLVDIMDELNIK